MSNASHTSTLQLETRQLEGTLPGNAAEGTQVIEYNAADGNMSITPRSGDNCPGETFGVLCRGSMLGHFGGWGASEARSDTRTLERALRENTSGKPQAFEYNTETGNMALVPANATGRTGPAFGNVCREAMTREFGCGGGESGNSARGGSALFPKIGEGSPDAHGMRVAVLAGDDLEPAGSETMDGMAYTLEEEGVVRILRGRVDPYAKGQADTAVFVWGDGGVPTQQGERYVVHVSNGGKVTVSENVSGKECQVPEVMVVPRAVDHYRLGSGLLESPILKDRKVLLIGCGSMGGDLAMHLAMAGVGHISLSDPDRVEASNIGRLRDAGLADVGRFKVDMFAERILGKNPRCAIQTIPQDITKAPETLSGFLAETDLVVVSTDNRASRVLVAQGLQAAGKPCIYTRCSTRAESGDCFIARPGEACYECLYGMMGGGNDEIDDWASSKMAGRLAAYCTPEEMDDFKILPGISTDISAITSFAARLAIWELAKGAEDNPFLDICDEFSRFNYFLYVNRREKYFRNEAWAPFDKSGQRPCPQRWYGAAIARREDCTCCGSRSGELDSGDEDARLLANISTGKESQGN